MPLSDADIGLVPSKPKLSDEDIGLASPGPIQRLNQTFQRLTTDTATEPSMLTKVGAAMYPMVEPLTLHGLGSQLNRRLGLPDPNIAASPLQPILEGTPEMARLGTQPSELSGRILEALPRPIRSGLEAVSGAGEAARKGILNLTSYENLATIPAFVESLPLRAIIAAQALYNAGKTIQEAPTRLGELSVTGTPREIGREIAGDVGEVAMPFAVGKTLERPIPSTGTLPEDYSINRLADIPIRTPERGTETGRPVRGPQVGEPVGLLGQGQGFEVGPSGEARRVGPSPELGELIRQRWDPSIPVLGGTESFTDPKTGLTIEKIKPGASEKEIQSRMAAKLQEEKRYAGAPIDPDELRPAIRLMSGQLLRGQKGQVHDDIIRDHNLKATDVDRRGFVGPTGWVDREEGPDSGYPVPGLHANDLAQIQERQVIPSERQEKGSQEGQQELLDPGKTLAASKFAKMQEAASGDKRRQAEAERQVKAQDYSDVGQRLYSGAPIRFAEREKELRGPFALTGPRLAITPSQIGFAKTDAPVDAVQLKNRLKNKLSPTEWAIYQDAGIEQALQGKVTPEFAAAWMQEHGPRVEVRSSSVKKPPSDLRNEYNKMTHEWADNLNITDRALVFQMAESNFPERRAQAIRDLQQRGFKEIEKAKQFSELAQRLRQEELIDVSGQEPNWQSISPKPEGEMPGYVEIAVVKPQKMTPGGMGPKGDEYANTYEPEKFPSTHSFPPNTVVFVRGYMEGDTFHVIEVQSDWAQRNREYNKIINQPDATPISGELREASRVDKQRNAPDEVLLQHYERLALKAAIDHARQQGAKRVAIQDAESAMMMEGHDRAAQREAFDTGKTGEELVPQAAGMRLHYDRTLPKIMEELTGAKGEKVSFGEHKMAHELSNPVDQTFDPRLTRERNPVRKDLIFRNPDSTLKTDVSATSFPIGKAGGPGPEPTKAQFSLFEKDKPDTRTQYLYSGVPIPVKEAWDTIKSLGKYSANRKAVPQLLDAADSAAKIGGRQKGNSFRYSVPDEIDRKAITFISETLDNRKGLDTFASMVKGNKEATAAIERARSGWDRLYPKAVELSKQIENQRQVELANNVETPFLENYIKHTFEDDELGFMQTGSGGAGVSTAFLKDRTFPNYATAIQEGYKPKTLDAAKLLESRVAAGLKLVNRYRWAESMKGLKTTDGDPLVAPLTRKAGKIVTPDGYQQVEMMPGVRMNVANDYAPLFKALMGESQIRASALGEAALKVESAIKHGLLLFDSYHAFRVLRKELFLTGKVSYNKSLSLLEHDAKTIDLMEKNGDISKEHADWVREHRADAQLAIKTGLNVGRLSEALYNEVMRKELKVAGVDINLPGRFNKWVFDKVSRGVMLQSWLTEFNRKIKTDPARPRNDVAMETSREMNIYYGNLMRQGVLKSQTARDAAQIFMLAPQWFESMVRTEAGAAKQLATAPTDYVRGKPIGGLGKAVGTGILAYFVANQLVNNLTKGHPTWDNEEEGHKLDAWIPSVTSKGGFWLSPFSDVAEVTHDYVRYGAKGLNPLESTARIISNKTAPLARFGETLYSGEDFSGTKLKGIRRVGEAAKSLLPTPLPLKGLEGDVPGQTERQAYSSIGLKVEPQSSEERRQAETKGMSLRDRVLYDKKQKTEMQQRELKQPLEKREEASLRAGQLAREGNVKRGQEVYNKLTKADQMWIASRRLTVPELEDELSLKGQKIRLTKPESEKLIRYTQEEYSQLAMPILRANYDRLPVQEAKDKLFSQVMTAARQRARVRLEREMLGSKNEPNPQRKRFSAFDFLR